MKIQLEKRNVYLILLVAVFEKSVFYQLWLIHVSIIVYFEVYKIVFQLVGFAYKTSAKLT